MNRLDIHSLQVACREHRIIWSMHMLTRLLQRQITQADVENAIQTGEIIEQYPDDYPHPSCLVLGMSVHNRRIHVVCGMNESTVYMITAYIPDKDMWESDLKTRKQGGDR